MFCCYLVAYTRVTRVNHTLTLTQIMYCTYTQSQLTYAYRVKSYIHVRNGWAENIVNPDQPDCFVATAATESEIPSSTHHSTQQNTKACLISYGQM